MCLEFSVVHVICYTGRNVSEWLNEWVLCGKQPGSLSRLCNQQKVSHLRHLNAPKNQPKTLSFNEFSVAGRACRIQSHSPCRWATPILWLHVWIKKTNKHGTLITDNHSAPKVVLSVTPCLMRVSRAWEPSRRRAGSRRVHHVSVWKPLPLHEAHQSEHLCTALCLPTKSKAAAITASQWRGKES